MSFSPEGADETQGLTAQEAAAHAQKLRRVTSARGLVRKVSSELKVANSLRLRESAGFERRTFSSGRPKEPGDMFDDYAYDEDDSGDKIPRGRILQAEFEEMMRTEYGDVRDDDILSLWEGFLASENAAARKRNQPPEHMLSKAEFVRHMLEYGMTDYERDSAESTNDYGDVDLQEASDRAVRERQEGVRCWPPSTWYIHPDGAFRVSWDVWLLILIFYVALCVPLRIGFDIFVVPWNAWFVVDLIADLTFFIDVFLNFFTGYTDAFGLHVSRGRDVAYNYLGWGPQKAYTIVPATSVDSSRQRVAGSGRSLSSMKDDASMNVTLDVKFQKEEEAGDAIACSDLCTYCCRCCCHTGVPETCKNCALVTTRFVRMPLRGWFIVDFVSCLPVTYVALIFDDDNSNLDGSLEGDAIASSTRAVRVVRLLRLAKLLRLARIGRLLEKYCEDLREFYQGMSVLRAMCTTVAMAHWTACSWHFLGVDGFETCPPASAEGCSWFEKSTLKQLGSDDDRLWDRYSTSLYWSATTLTTVGYGDVTPVTSSEMMFAVFIEVLGTCTFAYTAGTLSSVIMESKLDPKVQEYNEKMPKIKEYLRSHRVPRSERIRIRAHFDRVFHEHKAIDERNVLQLMPGGIKGPMARNVVKTIYSDTYKLLASSKLFHWMGDLALVDLIVRLEPVRYRGPCREFPDGEQIIRQGGSCVDIYIITSGCCRSIARAEPPYDEEGNYGNELREDDVEMLLKKGDIFGERSALEQGGGTERMEATQTVLARGQLPTGNLTAEQKQRFLRQRWSETTAADMEPTMTTVHTLSASNLGSFLDEFAEYRKKLPAVVRLQIEKEEHKKRVQRLKKLCPIREQADKEFSSIIEAWKDGSTLWAEQAGQVIERKMNLASGEQLRMVRGRNDSDCLALIQVQVFLKPWQRWLISTTLPEPEYMELLSSIFDPDGDRNITRDEFWNGIMELKDPKHFKRKFSDEGMDDKMKAVAGELVRVQKEVNDVHDNLKEQFTTVHGHLADLTATFQQFMEAHSRAQ